MGSAKCPLSAATAASPPFNHPEPTPRYLPVPKILSKSQLSPINPGWRRNRTKSRSPYLDWPDKTVLALRPARQRRERNTGLLMRASHVGIGRLSVVGRGQCANTVRISKSLVLMRMESEIGSRSRSSERVDKEARLTIDSEKLEAWREGSKSTRNCSVTSAFEWKIRTMC